MCDEECPTRGGFLLWESSKIVSGSACSKAFIMKPSLKHTCTDACSLQFPLSVRGFIFQLRVSHLMQLLPGCSTYESLSYRDVARQACWRRTWVRSWLVVRKWLFSSQKRHITTLALSDKRDLLLTLFSTTVLILFHLSGQYFQLYICIRILINCILLICQNSAKRICRICSVNVCRIQQLKGRFA